MSTDSRRQSESSGSIHSTLLQQVGNRDAGAWRRLVQSDFGETTWRAFWRVTVDQQRSDLVAEEMDISVNAVRKAKAPVLQRLREEFGELLD